MHDRRIVSPNGRHRQLPLKHRSVARLPKSRTTPSQDPTWRGKGFGLKKPCVYNTKPILLHTLALALAASWSPVHKKVAERVTGFALWAMRPHRGATLSLRGDYLTQNNPRRYLRRPTPNMSRGLMDSFALSCLTYTLPQCPPAPLLGPVVCWDAAKSDRGYQVGRRLLCSSWVPLGHLVDIGVGTPVTGGSTCGRG